MKLEGAKYDQALENTDGSQFKELASKLEATVSFFNSKKISQNFFFFVAIFDSPPSTLFTASSFESSLTSFLSPRISWMSYDDLQIPFKKKRTKKLYVW